MQTRFDQARERAMTLAAKGKPDGAIIATLRQEGLDGAVSHREIERLITEAAVARKLKTGSGVHRLFRAFGVLVMIAGVLALSTGTKWPIWAIVCGLFLALFPENAAKETRLPWR